MVGGQEDMIEDTAMTMARERGEDRTMKLDKATIARSPSTSRTRAAGARRLTKITDEYPDLDWDDAYAIQDEIRAASWRRGASSA
jgi:hypothetical protein